jgi:8-oxo-dGTP pyrophosphatase MutT (NUDIX family)
VGTQPDEKQFTVSAFILSSEVPARMLLIHHKKFHKWMQPGGHIEKFENPIETIIREVQEETGLDISACFSKPSKLDAHVDGLPIPAYLQEQRIPESKGDPAHYHLDLGYVVTVPHGLPAPADNESTQIDWFTLDQLDGLEMFDNVRDFAKHAFRAAGD